MSHQDKITAPFDEFAPNYDQQLIGDQQLFDLRFKLINQHAYSDEEIDRVKAVYQTDLALCSAERVANLISKGGFAEVVPFLQAGLLYGGRADKQRRHLDSL